jgi:very-short-patch-repair endonuclease
LVVEVDGSQHMDNPHDESRTRWLNAEGYKVLRFWNNEVLLETDAVLEVIQEALAESIE